MIHLGKNEICVPCSESPGVYWANGIVSFEDMVEGARAWEDLDRFVLDYSHVEHLWVSHCFDGEEDEDECLFWACHKDDIGAFLVTRLNLEEF